MRINLEVPGVLKGRNGSAIEVEGPIWISKVREPFYFNDTILSIVSIPTLIGHRGMGMGEHKNENKISAINKCKTFGTMVEIDVQLTKDMVAVVVHDTSINGTRVEDLTLDQAQALGIETLEQVLIETEIDLNIEIKYENQRVSEDQWCTEILNVVNTTVKPNRGIVYSSFHPEICKVLKKTTKSVLYLTETLTAEIIDHVHEQKYLGIVTEAQEILSKPDLLWSIKQKYMYVITYGINNTCLKSVSKQRMLGVDSIITDDIEILSQFI
ncbi:glycerophosphodiester phosphodiesterase [Nematocida sp. AWRm80]|nr:glycerophosphodiester phosphodiesterase [Nematocida sp. AWRm80]